MRDQREGTSHDPKLPEHDERAPNASWGHLGRVDGYRGVLCTDTDTHYKSGSKQALP